MTEILRLQPRNPAPQPIGTRQLRRKLEKIDRTLGWTRTAIGQFGFCDDDDADGRLRALQQLDVELLNLHTDTLTALHEVSMLLELAMDDYTRERAQRDRQVADLSAERARRAVS